MAIPKVDALELTLATFSVTRPSQTESYQRITVVPCTTGVDETGNVSDIPEIVLWASGEKGASVDSVIARLQTELGSHGHIHDKTTTLIVVGLGTLSQPESCRRH